MPALAMLWDTGGGLFHGWSCSKFGGDLEDFNILRNEYIPGPSKAIS